MVVQVASGCPKVGFGLAEFVETPIAEAGVLRTGSPCEIETVLNQRSASKGVIAYAIAAHPGIQERQGEKKKKNEQALRFTRAGKRRWARVLLSTNEVPAENSPIPGYHPYRTASRCGANSQDRGRDLVNANNHGGIVPHDFASELVPLLRRVRCAPCYREEARSSPGFTGGRVSVRK